jgi:cation-transporting ATPase I
VRVQQHNGKRVVCLADTVEAAEAFDLCDLAISLTGEHSFIPLPADFLAPDLAAVATILETGAQRDAAIRDAVGLSVIANIIGLLGSVPTWPGARLAPHIV